MSARLLIWASLAGAFIPVMAILNSRLGKTLGENFHAPVIAFMVAITLGTTFSFIATKSLPDITQLPKANLVDYLGGFIVCFYVFSATFLAPRMGVANFIVCAVSAQIVVSVVIDNYGLLGAALRPVSLLRIGGVALLLLGLIITQLADSKQSNQ